MYLDKVIDRRIGLVTQILPSLFHVILLSQVNPRHIKRLKVQACLRSDSYLQKAHPLQVPDHNSSHNGCFLRQFLLISAVAEESATFPAIKPICILAGKKAWENT